VNESCFSPQTPSAVRCHGHLDGAVVGTFALYLPCVLFHPEALRMLKKCAWKLCFGAGHVPLSTVGHENESIDVRAVVCVGKRKALDLVDVLRSR
jgi:hypothetical protein